MTCKTIDRRRRHGRGGLGAATAALALAAVAMPLAAPPAAAAPLSRAQQLHALAVHSFRQARFSEAYGRFIALAEAGHPASARYALWMCINGPALFGVDWDCAPHEAEAWARLAGVEAPQIVARSYPPVGDKGTARGRRPGS